MGFFVENCGRYIPLTQGQKTLVDAGVYYDLIKYKWHARGHGNNLYAARIVSRSISKNRLHSYMARELIGAPSGLIVDHINRNTLDNRRSNLRVATRHQNCRNALKKNSRIGTIGTAKNMTRGKDKTRAGWRSSVSYLGRKVSAGSFKTQREAAIARDALAKKLHGEFAVLNFPEEEK